MADLAQQGRLIHAVLLVGETIICHFKAHLSQVALELKRAANRYAAGSTGLHEQTTTDDFP